MREVERGQNLSGVVFFVLAGGDPQAVVLAPGDNGAANVVQATSNVATGAPTLFQNLVLYTVPSVLR